MNEQQDNLAIWNRHKKTNPAHTKKVNQRGGYTAINPMHQAELATSEFGPYGMGWGLSDLEYEMVETEALDDNGKAAKSYSLSLVCNFTFYQDGHRRSFPVSADMSFKHGHDCYKKLRTECQSKALSLLGFNADIYQGNWEDSGYVEARRREFGDQETRLTKGLQAAMEASTVEAAEKLKGHILNELQSEAISSEVGAKLLDAINERINQLKEAN